MKLSRFLSIVNGVAWAFTFFIMLWMFSILSSDSIENNLHFGALIACLAISGSLTISTEIIKCIRNYVLYYRERAEEFYEDEWNISSEESADTDEIIKSEKENNN